jgi:hypothetical protein
MTLGQHEEVLRRLAVESGRLLGQLGVRPEDERWIDRHAATVASLVSVRKRRGPIARFFYRLASRAARMAR